MTVAQLVSLVGQNISFQYADELRTIEVVAARQCNNGNQIVTGIDRNVEGSNQYRSFRINAMLNVTVG